MGSHLWPTVDPVEIAPHRILDQVLQPVVTDPDGEGTCVHCLERFRDPVSLPCHHTMCNLCARAVLSTRDTCPVCLQRLFIDIEVKSSAIAPHQQQGIHIRPCGCTDINSCASCGLLVSLTSLPLVIMSTIHWQDYAYLFPLFAHRFNFLMFFSIGLCVVHSALVSEIMVITATIQGMELTTKWLPAVFMAAITPFACLMGAMLQNSLDIRWVVQGGLDTVVLALLQWRLVTVSLYIEALLAITAALFWAVRTWKGIRTARLALVGFRHAILLIAVPLAVLWFPIVFWRLLAVLLGRLAETFCYR